MVSPEETLLKASTTMSLGKVLFLAEGPMGSQFLTCFHPRCDPLTFDLTRTHSLPAPQFLDFRVSPKDRELLLPILSPQCLFIKALDWTFRLFAFKTDSLFTI